ncbi:hypothetical protein ZWY2020_026984 [Hordeum vulgare]|nr:hypothetical protein ZWY2020_026984 [Hordeum vulgare]
MMRPVLQLSVSARGARLQCTLGAQHPSREPAAGGDGEVSIQIARPDYATGAGGDTESSSARTRPVRAVTRPVRAARAGGTRCIWAATCSTWRGGWSTRCPSPCSCSASSTTSTCFFVMIWISAVMLKSNDILRKETALKATGLGSDVAGVMWGFGFGQCQRLRCLTMATG